MLTYSGEKSMITIDDTIYIFDIEAIYDFVNYSDRVETKEKEIIDSYEGSKVVGKTIRELTAPGNAAIDNIKYDLVKTFLIQVITYEGDVITLADVPFGTKLAINTLIANGFLKEIISE